MGMAKPDQEQFAPTAMELLRARNTELGERIAALEAVRDSCAQAYAELEAENAKLKVKNEILAERPLQFEYDNVVAKNREDERVIIALQAENAKLRAALRELYAEVQGEASQLLDDDRGGNGRLDLEIQELLAAGIEETGK